MISVSTIDVSALDTRMMQAGLLSDLEAEFDGGFTTESHLEAGTDLADDEMVRESDLLAMFWTWVSDEDAGLDRIAPNDGPPDDYTDPYTDEEREVAYFNAAESPFGEVVNNVSLGDDDGAYVLFVLPYSDLLQTLTDIEDEAA